MWCVLINVFLNFNALNNYPSFLTNFSHLLLYTGWTEEEEEEEGKAGEVPQRKVIHKHCIQSWGLVVERMVSH